MVSNEELIQKATSVINSRKIDDVNFVGQVGCALITDKGNVYTGVSIDTGAGMGFCAEANAIGSMVTAGESRIEKIVATWKDGKGDVYVVSPCGRCRQFICAMNKENINTEVILNKESVVKLSDLLPHLNEYNKI